MSVTVRGCTAAGGADIKSSGADHPRRRVSLPAGLAACAVVLAAASATCNEANVGTGAGPPTTRAAAELSQPIRLSILPFTKPKSFDGDAVPDGVEVALRTTDVLNDPVKGWGTFHFELHRFRRAARDPRGEEVQSWTLALATAGDQAAYWDRVTQTYRFPLGWEGAPLLPNQRYVLDAWFVPPLGPRAVAEPYIFEFRPDLEALRAAASPQEGD